MDEGRKQARQALGAAAVFPLGEAIELLPLSRPEARAWLQENGLVSYIKGRPVVVWSAVLEALKNQASQPGKPDPKSPPKPRPRLGRTPL